MKHALAALVGLMLLSTNAWANNITTARNCSAQLLSAYNARQYPANIIDAQRIIQRAFGADYRGMNSYDKQVANPVALSLLKETFTKSSYRYRELYVTRVDPKRNNGYRAVGTVHVTSREFTGVLGFEAYSAGPCHIYYVEIAGFKTIESILRTKLKNHPKTKKLFR